MGHYGLIGLNMLSEQIEKNIRSEGAGTMSLPIQIVVSGGANAVLLFQNRQTTRDIDYCTEDPNVIDLISDANYSLMMNGCLNRFPHDWINSQMIAYVRRPGCENFYRNTLDQGIILFNTQALQVYVADFKFQLVGNVTRAYQDWIDEGQPDAETYDGIHLSDAVHILNKIIAMTGQRVRLSEMRTWYFFGAGLEVAEIDFANNAYCRIFNVSIRPISVST